MPQPEKKNQSTILDFFSRKRPAEDADNGEKKSCKQKVIDSPLKVAAEVLVIDLEDEYEVNGLDDDLLDVIFEETKEVGKASSEESSNDSGLGLASSALAEESAKKDFIYTKFHSIVRTVMSDECYTHLFDDEDWSILHGLTCLPGPTQLTYLKLYTRNHNWIRMHTIRTLELENNEALLNESIEALLKNDFLQNSSTFATIEEALNLMSLPELKQFLAQYKGFQAAKSNKAEMIPNFVDYVRSTKSAFGGETIEDLVLKKLRKWFNKKCIRINEKQSQFLDRLFLLHHNPYFLLSKLDKKHSYQWYRCVFYDFGGTGASVHAIEATNKKAQVYDSKPHFLDFYTAFKLVEQIMIETAERHYSTVCDVLFPLATIKWTEMVEQYSAWDTKLAVHLRPYTAAGMCMRALHECLTSLERSKHYREYVNIVRDTLLTQDLYGHKYRSHWYKRGVLITQTHLKQVEEAKKLCVQGLEDHSLTAGSRLEVYQRLVKMIPAKEAANNYAQLCPLAGQIGYPETTIESQYCTIQNDSKMKNFFMVNFEEEGGDECCDSLIRVENVVILHYQKQGYSQGVHCESSVYVTLFGLVMWDIIYDISNLDSFRFHKQMAPLDLNYPSFFEKRRLVIEAKLEQVANWDEEEMVTVLQRAWLKNYGKASLVAWREDEHYLPQLMDIAVCFGPDRLSKICRVLAMDYRSFRKGLPDLIVWNRLTKAIKLIEVKSHHDRISTTQSIWLTYLKQFGFDVELCHVKPKKKGVN